MGVGEGGCCLRRCVKRYVSGSRRCSVGNCLRGCVVRCIVSFIVPFIVRSHTFSRQIYPSSGYSKAHELHEKYTAKIAVDFRSIDAQQLLEAC